MGVTAMKTRLIAAMLLTATCAFLLSCSSTSGPSEPADPTVASGSPADGATDVGLVEQVVVRLSKDMDATTINDTTLVVTARGLEGWVEYEEDERAATFTPETLYAAETWFDVVVSDAMTDEDGNPLAAPETLSFRTGVFDCAHLEDHLEPNDSVGEAVPIELYRTYRTLTGCGDDTDFYRFTLQETVKVLPLAAFRHADNELCYVYIRRADGEDYSYMGSYIDTGEFLGGSSTLAPGTYLIEVMRDGDYDGYVIYDFSLDTTDPCADDGHEDNDFFDEAAPISPGTLENLIGCRVDRDYYAVDLNAGERLTVVIETEAPTGTTRRYKLYDPSEGELDSYQGTGNPVTITAIAGVTGTYYIFVRYWTDGIIYDMDVEVIE